MKSPISAGFFALLITQPVFSADLLSSYKNALSYDSGIAEAKANLEASESAVTISRSSLLPQIDAFADASHEDVDEPTSEDSYKLYNYGVQLTQPLFRADDWFRRDVSEFESEAAWAQYNLAQQTLMLEVAQAYFNVLRTKDTLITALATEKAIERQYDQAKERFDVGLIAITEVYEARASYDDSRSERIAAENDLNIAKERLARLTGTYPAELENLQSSFELVPPVPMDASAWERIALAQNWSIKAQEFEREANEAQLKVAKAGHYPTLDLTASRSDSEITGLGGRSSFETQSSGVTTQSVIALRLNVPLYSGGGTQAAVRQQRSRLEAVEQQLKTIRRDVQVESKSLYLTVNNNIESAAALRQTIISRRSALDATRAGYQVGTRNIVEVLDAERAYYVALRDFANARYDYIVNTLELKLRAGTLSPEDLAELNNFLSPEAPGIKALAEEEITLETPVQ